MKPVFYLRHLALALAITVLTAAPAQAVVNGEFDELNMFPEVGAIVVTEIPEAFPGEVTAPQAISSGTLIHPRVLLTAGHTVVYMLDQIATFEEIELNDFVVSFDPDVTGEVPFSAIEIEAVDIHPDFFSPQNDPTHDVGVIILAEPAPQNIPLVPPPRIGLLDDLVDSGELTIDQDGGGTFVVVGYGATEESQGIEPPFTELMVLPSGRRHVGMSEFRALRRNQLHITRNQLRAEDVGGPAPGDSGGPIYWVEEDSETGELVYEQVALVSWGDNVEVELAVNARIDVLDVQLWLADVIDEVTP